VIDCPQAGALRVRLYETAGQATRATVSLPFWQAERGTQITFNGEKIRPVSMVPGAMTLDFKPWEIVNVSLTTNHAAIGGTVN
jgi:hypothetical protein